MVKRVFVVIGVLALVVLLGAVSLVFVARNYVPSPFTKVTLRANTVVATTGPDTRFLVMRAGSHELEDASPSEPLKMRDGESVRLQSPHTGYTVLCRILPAPAGLYVEGEWHLHSFPKSFVKKWFVKAE